MMALLSPHVVRPRWARRRAETKRGSVVSEGERLGLLGPRDREVSIETISLAVSGVTETEERPDPVPEKKVINRLELRQKVRNSSGNFEILVMTRLPTFLHLTRILESLLIFVYEVIKASLKEDILGTTISVLLLLPVQ